MMVVGGKAQRELKWHEHWSWTENVPLFFTQAVKEESVFCLGPALSCISAVRSPLWLPVRLSNRMKIIFFLFKRVLNTVLNPLFVVFFPLLASIESNVMFRFQMSTRK